MGCPGGSVGKNQPASASNTGSISQGREDPLQEGMATHSSILTLGNPRDRGAWRATIHGVAKSQRRLSDEQRPLSTWDTKYIMSLGYELGTVPAHPWGAGLNPHLGRREETGIAPEKNWSRVSSWS